MPYFLLILLFAFAPVTNAREFSVLDEAAQLGTMGGLAEACHVAPEKLDDYELIAARLIALKTNSAEQEVLGYRRYAEEKNTAIRRHQNSPQMSCAEILYRFENMPLFQSVVYQDGSLKLSDGTVLKARRAPAKLIKK